MATIGLPSVIIVATVLCGTSVFARAQTAFGKISGALTLKNAEEAVRMEGPAGKEDGWVRDSRTGQLIFVSARTPHTNYPRLINTTPAVPAKAEASRARRT